MSVTVALWGGPLDGRMVDLTAPPWAPPLTLRIPDVLVSGLAVLATPEDVPFVVHAYDRHPSPAEDGPVWRYVYRRTE